MLSPVWLFTQFHDLLLMWLGAIVLVALLPIYRFGWWMIVAKEQAIAVRALFVLFVVSSLALVLYRFYDLPGAARASAALPGGGQQAPGVALLMSIAELGLALALLAVAAVVSVTVLVIASARKQGKSTIGSEEGM